MVKLGMVLSEFNLEIVNDMRGAARRHAEFLGADVVTERWTPGVYDMPLAVKKLLDEGEVDAVVTLGAVIKGATGHDEVVTGQASRKFTDLSVEYGVPVTLGISGPDQTRHEATQRVGYAKRAVEAAVKMAKRT
ncbi:MAG: 6,7-dimethyl-8-ribityllumazine synthase [Methanonatronarchaeales archaeon]|nr:6,7-dimethyl-8-ribityllumazine synthase [Methanonatronarchaeales archaeon]